MKLTKFKNISVLLAFLMLIAGSFSAQFLNVFADDDLPVDPDFVRTWETVEPTSEPVATVTAKPVATPAKKTTVQSTPTITDADRQAVATANQQEKALLNNYQNSQLQQNQIQSLAEDSLQKYQALHGVTSSLRDELLALDDQQKQTKDTIKRIEQELTNLNQQLDATTNKLLLKRQEMSKQKMAVVSYVQAMYEQQNTSVLQVLLSNKTFSDSLDELNHMQSLESAGRNLLDQLKASEVELHNQQEELQQRKDRIDSLRTQLEQQQDTLEQQATEERFLLDKTQGKEEQYQAMLQDFQRQNAQVEADIANLRTDIAKLKDASSLADIQTKFGDKYALTNPQNGAIWPVDASYKGISAYFNDSGYSQLFGFPHHAIDIPEPAETPIRAPANGVVLHVVDNDGGSYNYVVLYHGTDDQGRDITTVYGHLPKIFVKKGDIIHKGDIIAVTGGMPGTRGTGPYYTGPHLHFEVRQNGVAIDPLTWLP